MFRTISTETTKKVGETVKLNGWVNNRRNMGKIVFLDVRDRWGIVQVVCVPSELDETSQAALSEVRSEFVLEIEGVVQARGEKQINANSPTGTVEVLAKKIAVLSKAETPPFEIENETLQAGEELRLKYRYLDLRHERMKNNMLMRSKMMHFVRNYLHDKEFVEIQTPILSKSTPEGARDYLVPSRKYLGKFFALPQSPQQYKQMLMVAGMEKYFQIAPCFRDEDARADRSPGEFYQIDMEMSFVKQDDILQLAEEMFTKMVKELWPEKHFTFEPWPRLKHKEVMEKYGVDKPDLRKNKEDKDELAFAWVIDFPLFTEQTAEDFFQGAGDKWAPSHHMFTAPKEEDIPLLDSDPGKVKSYQHDLVLNGWEVGGGSIRIHDANLQRKIFDLIGFTAKDKESFAHLLKAFEFGVPPHGGIAPGFDRLLSILQGEKSIREVIAFPLLADAHDPLMDAPSEVSEKQLKELNININN
ncbi:MAG TPA: aspartate--tRNA ligase [bacterium]|nr:aspartate--tRNA ligase [bacterium]